MTLSICNYIISITFWTEFSVALDSPANHAIRTLHTWMYNSETKKLKLHLTQASLIIIVTVSSNMTGV